MSYVAPVGVLDAIFVEAYAPPASLDLVFGAGSTGVHVYSDNVLRTSAHFGGTSRFYSPVVAAHIRASLNSTVRCTSTGTTKRSYRRTSAFAVKATFAAVARRRLPVNKQSRALVEITFSSASSSRVGALTVVEGVLRSRARFLVQAMYTGGRPSFYQRVFPTPSVSAFAVSVVDTSYRRVWNPFILEQRTDYVNGVTLNSNSKTRARNISHIYSYSRLGISIESGSYSDLLSQPSTVSGACNVNIIDGSFSSFYVMHRESASVAGQGIISPNLLGRSYKMADLVTWGFTCPMPMCTMAMDVTYAITVGLARAISIPTCTIAITSRVEVTKTLYVNTNIPRLRYSGALSAYIPDRVSVVVHASLPPLVYEVSLGINTPLFVASTIGPWVESLRMSSNGIDIKLAQNIRDMDHNIFISVRAPIKATVWLRRTMPNIEGAIRGIRV